MAFALPTDTDDGVLVMLASDDGTVTDRRFDLLDDDGPTITRLRGWGFDEMAGRAVQAEDGHTLYRFFWLEPNAVQRIGSSYWPLPEEAGGPDGLRLHAYFLEPLPSGSGLRLSLLWSVLDRGLRAGYQGDGLVVRVLGNAGELLGMRKEELYQQVPWRPDDLLITEHEFGGIAAVNVTRIEVATSFRSSGVEVTRSVDVRSNSN